MLANDLDSLDTQAALEQVAPYTAASEDTTDAHGNIDQLNDTVAHYL